MRFRLSTSIRNTPRAWAWSCRQSSRPALWWIIRDVSRTVYGPRPGLHHLTGSTGSDSAPVMGPGPTARDRRVDGPPATHRTPDQHEVSTTHAGYGRRDRRLRR